MIRFFATSALVIAALTVPLIAQEGESVRSLKARCLSFQIDGSIPELYAHTAIAAENPTDGVPVEVRNYLNHQIDSIPLYGSRVIFTTDPDPASVKDSKKVLAKVKVADDLRSAILMFVPGTGEDGDPPYRVLPVEDSPREFPRGSLKVMNLSPTPIRLMLEKQRYDLKPSATRVIEDPPVGDRNSSAMQAFIFRDEKWQRIGSGLWPHPGKKRVLQIAFFNPSSRNIEIRGIRDIAVRD